MTKVIDVDKLITWISVNQRDEASPIPVQAPAPSPAPSPSPSPSPQPSGPWGSKTNPFKMNKPSLGFNVFIPENTNPDSNGLGPVSLSAGAKLYFEVDPNGNPFKIMIKFYSGAGVVCKLTQNKLTGLYSAESCQGSDGFMDIVLSPLGNTKYLYAIDNTLSFGAVNDAMWIVMPFIP